MAKKIVPDTTTSRVPRKLVTSKNCVTFPAGNKYTFHNGVTVHQGDELVFDLDGLPKHGDLVLMHSDGRTPFVRCCEVAPVTEFPRSQWCMGVLDGDDIVFIDMRPFDRVGVCTGIHKAGAGWRSIAEMLEETPA